MIRIGTRAAALSVLGLLTVLVLAAPASAHSPVKWTRPAENTTVEGGPRRVVIRFHDPIETGFAKITVTDRGGDDVHRGKPRALRGRDDTVAVRLDRELAGGPYTVVWRIVAADGHVEDGSFGFFVAAGEAPARSQVRPVPNPPAAAPPAGPAGGEAHAPGNATLTTLRGVLIAALVALTGAAAFWVMAWRGAGPQLVPARRDVEAAVGAGTAGVAAAAAAVTLLGSLASLAVYPAAAAGVPLADGMTTSLFDAMLGTRFAQITVGRLVVLELLALVVVAWRWRPAPQASMVGAAALRAPLSKVRVGGASVLLLGLLATASGLGHAATTSPVLLHMTLDVAHLAAAGVWIGGLVILVAVVFPATSGLAGADRVGVLAPVVGRFSSMAAVSISVLVATGVARAWPEIRSMAALTGTGYGRALLVKGGLFATLVLLGAVNHWWARPRLRDAARRRGETSALGVLRRTVQVETLLGAGALIVTTVLVSLPPAG